MQAALSKRPEVLAAKAQSEAAELQLSAARRSFLPSASASAGIDWRRTDFDSAPLPGWSVGASVNWPIYEGGATHAAVGQAAAAAQRNAASVDLMIQNITQEVQQAYLQELDARERITATAVAVEQAAEGLRLSQERYRAGAATSIEITDAELALANANIGHGQALFDYHVAHAQLRLAMGELQP
jgi:outer membrane protein TolC